ncbi:MAG: pantoate--beta-alanine ligase [Caldithrix sp.]|nr:MAG: pantoate--beta-alanine ligase [Caldithrix sp.]TDI93018.1 MAG: pantoate--beta-alanine ligase [Caldithrix sp.]
MKVFSEISEVRKCRWRDASLNWGLVPTMGLLHEGHLSLVRRARNENQKVGVSIFVNPIQFNNQQDLVSYPRDLERDLELLRKEGVDLVWTPTPNIVYATDFQTFVEVERITRPLEGKARPGHFRGVTTVVAKIFNVFQPHRAYFGQKDAQQAVVIRQMVRDLNFNLDLITCPTVRETDGLAMSSRNARLSPAARRQAVCLFRALTAAENAFHAGARNAAKLKSVMEKTTEPFDKARIDYISVAHPETLDELTAINEKALLSLALFIDDLRLIDNLILG